MAQSNFGYAKGFSEYSTKSLEDVSTTAPADNDVLAYDSVLKKWTPKALGGGGPGVGHDRQPHLPIDGNERDRAAEHGHVVDRAAADGEAAGCDGGERHGKRECGDDGADESCGIVGKPESCW